MKSLQDFLLYHVDLQNPDTIVTLPESNAHNRQLGVCYVVTPIHNLNRLKGVISHWIRTNPTLPEADQWLTDVSIQLSSNGVPLCHHCQLPGHQEAKCPSLAASTTAIRDPLNRPIPLCPRCRQTDVPHHPCISLSSVICVLCQQPGHTAAICQLGKRSWACVVTDNKHRNPNPNPTQANQPSHPPPQAAPAALAAAQPPKDLLSEIRAEQTKQQYKYEETIKYMQESFMLSIQTMQQQMQLQWQQQVQNIMTQQAQQIQQILTTILPLVQSNNPQPNQPSQFVPACVPTNTIATTNFSPPTMPALFTNGSSTTNRPNNADIDLVAALMQSPAAFSLLTSSPFFCQMMASHLTNQLHTAAQPTPIHG